MYSMHRSNKLARIFAAAILLVLFIFSEVYSSNDKDGNSGNQNNSSGLRNAIRSSRGYSRFDKGNQALEDGNVRYLRSTIVDGNLVKGRITNRIYR